MINNKTLDILKEKVVVDERNLVVEAKSDEKEFSKNLFLSVYKEHIIVANDMFNDDFIAEFIQPIENCKIELIEEAKINKFIIVIDTVNLETITLFSDLENKKILKQIQKIVNKE